MALSLMAGSLGNRPRAGRADRSPVRLRCGDGERFDAKEFSCVSPSFRAGVPQSSNSTELSYLRPPLERAPSTGTFQQIVRCPFDGKSNPLARRTHENALGFLGSCRGCATGHASSCGRAGGSVLPQECVGRDQLHLSDHGPMRADQGAWVCRSMPTRIAHTTALMRTRTASSRRTK